LQEPQNRVSVATPASVSAGTSTKLPSGKRITFTVSQQLRM